MVDDTKVNCPESIWSTNFLKQRIMRVYDNAEKGKDLPGIVWHQPGTVVNGH
jgi:hypothetical protein